MAVQNLVVNTTSDASVDVSWSEPMETKEDITGYEVEIKRYEANDEVVFQMRFSLSADARGLPITSLSECHITSPAGFLPSYKTRE